MKYEEHALQRMVREIKSIPDSFNCAALSNLREMAKALTRDSGIIKLKATVIETATFLIGPDDFGLDEWPDEGAREYVQSGLNDGYWRLVDFSGEANAERTVTVDYVRDDE